MYNREPQKQPRTPVDTKYPKKKVKKRNLYEIELDLYVGKG